MTETAQKVMNQLTQRQREVLVEVSSTGDPYSDIAARIGCSYQVLKNHIGKALDATGMSSRPELMIWAWRNGVVDIGAAN